MAVGRDMASTIPPNPDEHDAAPAQRRSRKTQKKREEIMAAAIRIMNSRTYALATMTEIAAELDLRDATLYYYFPSKQALFYACHLQSVERFQVMLKQADADRQKGAAKIERFLYHLIAESDRNGPLLYFGDYFHLEAEQRDHVTRLIDDLTVELEGFLKIGVDDGSIVPCETRVVVQLILGMLIWLAKWVPTMERLTADSLFDALKTFGLRGLRRNPYNNGEAEI